MVGVYEHAERLVTAPAADKTYDSQNYSVVTAGNFSEAAVFAKQVAIL